MISTIISLSMALGSSLCVGTALYLAWREGLRVQRGYQALMNHYEMKMSRARAVVVAAGHADPNEMRTAVNELASAILDSPPKLPAR